MTDAPIGIRSPFIEHLGIRVLSVGAEGAELELPVLPEYLNSVGMVHGGVYASLADSGLGAAIHGRLAPGHVALTAEMSCRYIRAARGGTLRCVSRVLHMGRSTAVAESEIWMDDVLQFKASGTFVVMPRS